ncbi:MAG: DUF3857 domain-containing protein [Bacteroidales bacterium]|nr:DUF3857 domain-containing protein [Bacteroidales bacterium]
MSKHSLWFSIALFLVLAQLSSMAQKGTYEFNKIEPYDFTRTYVTDTAAEAVVIADCGKTRFDANDRGFYLFFTRKTRIIIKKTEGLQFANVEIPLYKSSSSREKIMYLRAVTYNLVDGKVEKIKMKSEDSFLEEKSENWDRQKFTLPAVKVGSIIEFEYAVNSDFLFNLQSWTFQTSIPTYWSEYEVEIPDYYDYKKIAQGYQSMLVSESSRKVNKVIIGSNPYDVNCKTNRWVFANVPAFKPEPFTTTVKDHINKIDFELASVNFPGEPVENFADTWETINTKLLEHEKFGRMSKKGDFLAETLKGMLPDSLSAEDKLRTIYTHIQKSVKWNGEADFFADKKPSKTYEDKSGNSADINFLLVAALQESGFNADPLILSTRDHGMINTLYPILAKFNYVIAAVWVDSTLYLLDATSKLNPFNSLPERCLNGDGLIIDKTGFQWVSLLRNEIANKYTNAILNLNEDGKLEGKITVSTAGISSFRLRNDFITQDKQEFLKKISSEHPGWEITESGFENAEDPYKPFIETYSMSTEDAAQSAGPKIYLNALAGLGVKENPLKLATRVYPVDYGCLQKTTVLLNITLPEGWVVEEQPRNLVMTLPDKSASIKYSASLAGNTLSVFYSFSINKAKYLPDEYESLKELYRLLVAKHAEQFVLKKN